MDQNNDARRNFLRKAFSIAGVSILPGSTALAANALPSVPRIVEFVTRFPEAMSLAQYRAQKKGFENQDKVKTLVSVFKKSGKILEEEFSFHGAHCQWRVKFQSDAVFKEWMALTDELESHFTEAREAAGFSLEIRIVS